MLPAGAWVLDYESKKNEGIEFLKTKALDWRYYLYFLVNYTIILIFYIKSIAARA